MLRVFVNGTGVDVPAGAVARDAVVALDPSLAAALDAGAQRLTDSRGLPAASDAPLEAGAIFRLLPVRAPAAGATPDAAEEA